MTATRAACSDSRDSVDRDGRGSNALGDFREIDRPVGVRIAFVWVGCCEGCEGDKCEEHAAVEMGVVGGHFAVSGVE